ncbi:hypothetical protein, partial [Plasmodium yoelii yoelii]
VLITMITHFTENVCNASENSKGIHIKKNDAKLKLF